MAPFNTHHFQVKYIVVWHGSQRKLPLLVSLSQTVCVLTGISQAVILPRALRRVSVLHSARQFAGSAELLSGAL